MNEQLLGSHILIVDDHPLFRELLYKMLNSAGYRKITVLDNAPDALQLMQKERIDLLLLDNMMPEMSGLEMLEVLSTWSIDKRPAVLMITGDSRHELSVDALSLGALDILTKPVDKSLLMLRMRNLLEIEQYYQNIKSENSLLLQDVKIQKEIIGEQNLPSLTDAVSDLPNQVLFMDRLNHALVNAPKIGRAAGVILLDFITDFDQLSGEVQNKLINIVREVVGHNTIMRNNLHQFYVLIELIEGQHEIDLMLTELRSRIDQQGKYSLNIGVVVDWNGEYSDQQLIEELNNQRYADSDDKGNSLEEMLYLEIFHNNGESLVLHWQPQLAAFTQQVVAAEVLLRWEHEEVGEISPARFIPVAERQGWIVEISRILIDRALAQMEKWNRDDYIQFDHISINLSSNDLHSFEIVHYIESKLKQYRIEPQQLCVELTEGQLMEDVVVGQKVLKQLQTLGIQVALDDFGTGYSSLGYLRLFEFDIIKLDRSFILDIAENSVSRSIVHAICEMSRTLKAKTIVEGVETVQQLEYLLDYQVDLIQGFYFSKPLVAADLEAYVHSLPQPPGSLEHTESNTLQWSRETLGIGHQEMDQQHQAIFELIEQLRQYSEDYEAFSRTLTALMKQIEYHLLSEELLLREIDFPGLAAHHDEHEKIRKGMRQLVDIPPHLHSKLVFKFLNDIWISHIQKHDMRYRSYIKSASVGSDSG